MNEPKQPSLAERAPNMTVDQILTELRARADTYGLELGWGVGDSRRDTLDVAPFVKKAKDFKGANPLTGGLGRG